MFSFDEVKNYDPALAKAMDPAVLHSHRSAGLRDREFLR